MRLQLMPANVLACDALLVRLAAARQSLAEPLARAAALVVAHQSWLHCGYKTQGDFSREALHRDARWLRDHARQDRGTTGEMDASLDKLEATPAATDCASVTEPREPRVLLRQLVPPDVKLAFEMALELQRCVAGREVGAGEFVEALVGEAASAGCMPPEDFVPRARARSRAAPASRARPAPSSGATQDGGQGTREHDDAAQCISRALQTPALRQALHRLAEHEQLRARLRRLDMKLTVLERRRSTHPTACTPGGSKQKWTGISRTHRRDLRRLGGILAALLRLENGLDIAIGDLLLELHEHRSWALFGVTGLEEYAEKHLEIGRSTARRRVSLARSLRRLHALRSAYEAGEIGVMAATWVASGLRRVDANLAVQQLWIEHARRTTHKRQRDEERHRVCEHLRGMIAVARRFTPAAANSAPGTPVAPAANNAPGTPVAPNPPTARFSPRPGSRPGQPSTMTDEAWHASLRRVPGSVRHDVLALGCTLLDRILRGGPELQVPLVLDLSELDATNLLGCIEAAKRQLTALARRVLPPDDDSRLGPAARLTRVFVERGQRVPDWVGLLALLEEYVLSNDPVEKRRQRSRTAERDGYRCMAPGCTSRANLQQHHLRYRSQRGEDEDSNLVLLCAFHHLQGEHGGLAHCRGRAPLGIIWRLGHDEFATWYQNERRITNAESE